MGVGEGGGGGERDVAAGELQAECTLPADLGKKLTTNMVSCQTMKFA